MRLDWTDLALADLGSISAYLEREVQPEIAVRMLSLIRARANVLVEFPHAGPRLADQSVRSLRVRDTPYIILYRLVPDGLEVLRVYHERQNWRGPE
jgi:toxin ParE1/3/4